MGSRLSGTFNTGPDIKALPHDIGYQEAEAQRTASARTALQLKADRVLVNELGYGSNPAPGPVTFVYQGLMRGAFKLKADVCKCAF